MDQRYSEWTLKPIQPSLSQNLIQWPQDKMSLRTLIYIHDHVKDFPKIRQRHEILTILGASCICDHSISMD